jgi:hypothetical protein
MSKIKELKNNASYNVNLVEIIELFVPNKKTKYVELTLRLMKNTPEIDEFLVDVDNHLAQNYPFLNIDELKKLSIYQKILIVRFIESFFDSDSLNTLYKFCDYNERGLIVQNDLSRYKSFDEIKTQTAIADLKNEQNDMSGDIIKLYDTNEWLVLKPLTFLSSRKYGSNTKWCTTSEHNPDYFLKYSEKGILIYCINKLTGYKVASFYSLKHNDPEFSFWTQTDKRVDSMETDLTDEIKKIIKEECNGVITNRKLLTPAQIERENKFFETKMSKETIRHLINNNQPEPFPIADGLMSSRILRSFTNNNENGDEDIHAPSEEVF